MVAYVQRRFELRKREVKDVAKKPVKTAGEREEGAIGDLKSSRKIIVEQKTKAARMLHQCCDMCELTTFEI